MKYYSSTGDTGTSSLGQGMRVSKADPYIALAGALDETQTALGFAATKAAKHPLTAEINECLVWMQRNLFIAGAIILGSANNDSKTAWSWDTQLNEVEHFCSVFAPHSELKSFVLPGGSELAARIELARVTIRRLERDYCQLLEDNGEADTNQDKDIPKHPSAIPFLNRLSSLAFVLARRSNELLEVPEQNL